MSDRSEPTGRAGTNVEEVALSFVGRDEVLAQIASRLDDGVRLVTIVGPGGMGKTRVATRFASAHADAYAADGGGAWFCDLTAERAATGIASVVASVLGVQPSRSTDERSLVEGVGRALARRKRTLIVLDNAESVAAHTARVLDVWLRAAPLARFVVTSRVVLGVSGEHLLPLEPLAQPPASDDFDATLAADSVRLFVDRARAVRPGFTPGPGELAALREIVQVTDGIPLAIELAAARVRVLSLAQIRDRLAAPLKLLVKQNDDGRHASMRRAILHSYEQLEPAERTCLARCAVFRGGFTLEAAEAVIESEDRAVLDDLDALVSRSLVRTTTTRDGGIRFSLFETIRELAMERLAADETDRERTEARHARHFADVARALVDASAGARPAADPREPDLENLLAAHAHAIAETKHAHAPQHADDALAATLAVEPMLSRRGLLRRLLDMFDESIAAATSTGSEGTSSYVAEAIVGRGSALRQTGDLDKARADFEHALRVATARGDALVEARARAHLAELVEIDGDTSSARQMCHAALARLEDVPDGPGRRLREAELRARLSHAYRREGALGPAAAEIERAVVSYRDVGDEEGRAFALYEAAVIALFRRQYEASSAHFTEGLDLVKRSGGRLAEGALTTGRGTLLQELGNADDAVACHAEAARIFREVENPHREGSALYYLGGAWLEKGVDVEARRFLERALRLVEGVGVPRYEALVSACLATLAAREGDEAGAARWLNGADAAARACASESALEATIAIHRLHIDALRDAARVPASLEEARARAAAHSCDDPRFALRVFERAAAPVTKESGFALVLDADKGHVELPGTGARIDLSRRAPLCRILVSLVRRRIDEPGEPAAIEEIIAAGWPGERVRGEAGANRAYVALATLRKLGLRDVIEHGQGGYLIPPRLAVAFA
ncbi:MAG: AAA family ATPase [Polyangiaceae bacterium]|nr:AAA family ATPase [Polyangiaceae bacterium]